MMGNIGAGVQGGGGIDKDTSYTVSGNRIDEGLVQQRKNLTRSRYLAQANIDRSHK